MKLYKYREFDENSITALENNQIWFSTGNKFNDPFDCTLNLPMAWTDYDSVVNYIMNKTDWPLQYENRGYNKFQIKDMVSKSAKEFVQNSKIFEDSNSEDMSAILFGNLQKALVVSLSENCTNPLMWSHYASKHKGFCIEFNKSKLLESLEIYHHDKVDYSGKPYIVMDNLGKDDLHPAKTICFMKSPDWEYEEEYRLLHTKLSKSGNESIGCNYSSDAVEGIYFGLNTNEGERIKLMSKLRNRGYKFYLMGVDPKNLSYKLHPERELKLNS